MIVASDICCAGDCTFIVERDTGQAYGCGFNSSGQVIISKISKVCILFNKICLTDWKNGD
jgi:hypothetical protein